jgi:tetratricopeptide (TPR) repeat protein
MTQPQANGGRRSFVGREEELTSLLGGLEDARAGRGRFIGLVGEAGIGKTRTLEEFVARAGLPDDRILWGRCPEHQGLPAYWPWTQAVGGYVERCDAEALRQDLGRGAADVVQILPSIGDRIGNPEPPPPFDPTQSRLRLFDSMASFLRRTGEREPIVLVLDDLHWADEGSILLLAFLAPELRRSRTLLLGTYREREMKRSPRLLAEVARVSERIPLRGFELDEVNDFIKNRVDHAPKETLVAHLHRVSQGNPFFLDELVRMLRAEGRLEGEEDGSLGAHLPDEVREVIRRNLEPLSADDRSVLTCAAVIGYDFDVARLRAVSGLAADALLERLQAAAAAGVIEEIAGASGHFRFAHMLIRDAVYGEMQPLERARLHRRVGVAIEEMHVGSRDLPFGELARHFVHAAVLGDAAKALEYAQRAGEQDLSRLAYEKAAEHFEVALKVLRLDRPDEARELALRLSLGDAQTYAGDHPRARATFERAAERARALGDASSFARAALGFGFAAPGVGAVYGTLVALLEEALRLLGDADSADRATVLGSLASALYFSRDELRREELSSEAVAMARRVGDPGALARALLQRHHVLWGSDSVPERLGICDELIRFAGDSGDRPIALHGRLWRLVDLLDAGGIVRLDDELEGYTREASHNRIPLYRWFAGVLRSTRAWIDGRLAESERLADEAALLWQDGPLALPEQTRALQRFLVYLETGRVTEVERDFDVMGREYPAIPGWRAGTAIILAETGRFDEARALVDGFVARDFADLPRDANQLSSLASFAMVAHRIADADLAAAVYAALLPHAHRNASIGFAAGTYGACSRYLGLLAATLGRVDDAARHLDDALVANQRFGIRPLVAHTQYDYARVLLLRHERSKAEALLDEARGTAEQVGLTRLLERIGETGGSAPLVRPRTASAIFRREDASWTIAYEGRTIRVKHAKGNDYLAMLLQSPGREIHVLDLATGPTAGAVSSADPGGQEGVRRDLSSDAGEIIDAQARVAYKQRLADLGAELEEAQRFNDLGRAELVQEEIDSIAGELSRAIGLGGRHRKAGSAAERARVNVSRAIAAAVKKIAEEHPALGEHLAARVHTGTFCSYTPDPLVVVDWKL